MPVCDLLELPAALPPRAPLIGLDLGETTIGVAVSDVTRSVASPLILIRRKKFTDDAHALFAQMAGRGAGGLVIGLPLNMDGTEGARVQSTRTFVRQIAPLVPVPVCFWDERLSTAAVTRTLIEQDVSRAKRAEVVDRMAAAYILQGALDRLASLAS